MCKRQTLKGSCRLMKSFFRHHDEDGKHKVYFYYSMAKYIRHLHVIANVYGSSVYDCFSNVENLRRDRRQGRMDAKAVK